MKAARTHLFGEAEVMKSEKIERPVSAREILVKVYTGIVNPSGWLIR